MIAILSLLGVMFISLLISRTAGVALELTGLSRPSARFQAVSALTGVGFTTSEAEMVVTHPVRRRIVTILMITGNTGIVTAMVSLMLAFLTIESEAVMPRLALLALGLTLFWATATSKWFDRALDRTIRNLLKKTTKLNIRDYENLMQLKGGFNIAEYKVMPGDWMIGRNLGELNLRKEGILVLGLFHEDGFEGAPRAVSVVNEGDKAIVYGTFEAIERLMSRPSGPRGDADHRKAVQDFHAED